MPLNLYHFIIINAKGTTLEDAMHTCQVLISVQHLCSSIFSRGLPLPWAAQPRRLLSPADSKLPGCPLSHLFAQVLFKHPNQFLHSA